MALPLPLTLSARGTSWYTALSAGLLSPVELPRAPHQTSPALGVSFSFAVGKGSDRRSPRSPVSPLVPPCPHLSLPPSPPQDLVPSSLFLSPALLCLPSFCSRLSFAFFFFFFLPWWGSSFTWDLSSQTRDCSRLQGETCRILTLRPPGNSWLQVPSFRRPLLALRLPVNPADGCCFVTPGLCPPPSSSSTTPPWLPCLLLNRVCPTRPPGPSSEGSLSALGPEAWDSAWLAALCSPVGRGPEGQDLGSRCLRPCFGAHGAPGWRFAPLLSRRPCCGQTGSGCRLQTRNREPEEVTLGQVARAPRPPCPSLPPPQEARPGLSLLVLLHPGAHPPRLHRSIGPRR